LARSCATMLVNMSRKSRLGRFFGLLYVVVFLVVSGLWLIHAQQKQESNFTGNIKRIEDEPKPNTAHIHFDPSARTKWHIHEGGQIILVEEGVGRTQVKGGPVIEMHAGQTTYAAPGVAHWHGASPDQGATLFSAQRGTTTWLDAVTEKDYRTPPKR
jgi:quercetin dioxygenase-like cupin family protein